MTDQPTDYEAIAQKLEASVAAASPGPWRVPDFSTLSVSASFDPLPQRGSVVLKATAPRLNYAEARADAALAASAPQRALALAACVRALGRIANRARRIEGGGIDTTAIGAATYDLDVAEAALAAIRESEETP